ncbi:MAG: class I SAM-dependent methyltransferase [Flavobacteriales bacterium]|nr:class I SAM-dependent methyltransferase [Flavobacteriales bacterium]
MKAIQFIFRYINYFFKAKNHHSVQSPFVFQLVTKVINKKLKEKDCIEIEKLRKELCKSEIDINITDFGAGSNINKSNKRKVKDVAKNSAKSSKFGQLLYRIIDFYNPKNILELGTSLGVSSCYLAKSNGNSNVFTLEGCPETSKIAKENFEKLGIKNINLIVGNFKDTFDETLNKMDSLDLAFIDGNHQEKATIEYFNNCLEKSNNNTIFVFDDIHWSEGMENAWKHIQNHPKTSTTIDLFFVGIVFIKSELTKEHFTIRF